MTKYRCSRCDEIIDIPENLSEMEHEDCGGVLLELPEVSKIDTNKLRASHLTGLAGRIDQLIDQFGFIHMGKECDYPENEIQPYRGWGIYLDIPNGGILAVDIIHESGWWGRPTDEEFGYYHSTLIRDFAKAVIDEVERCIAEVPGQLNLF